MDTPNGARKVFPVTELVPGSRSVRAIVKAASGRQAGSAASGIQECKGEGASSSFSTRSRSSPARFFQSSTLTESLEHATSNEAFVSRTVA